MKGIISFFKEFFMEKELLRCPKSGELEIDPDELTDCVDCSREYYGK